MMRRDPVWFAAMTCTAGTFRENLPKKFSGMRILGLRNLFGRSGGDDFTTRITSFRAEIDDPIGALNHLQIVLDHHERMPAIHKALE